MKKLLSILTLMLATAVYAQCDYQLILQDNFGSAWPNSPNAGVNVTINGGTPTFYTIQNAGTVPNVETYTITVNDGDAIIFDYTAPNFSGDGEWSLNDSEGINVYNSGFNPDDTADFTGTASCPSCAAVSSLSTNNVTARTLDIAWTNGGTETQWVVEYGVSPLTPGTGVTATSSTNPYSITGLMPDTTYDICVQADCGPDGLSTAQCITVTTAVACAAPGAFSPVTNTANAISFIWDANGNANTNFEVEYGVAPYAQGNGGTLITGSPAPLAQVTGLQSNTTYDFYVRIDCGTDGFSTWSGPYTATTAQSCPDVSGVMFSNILQTQVDIAWSNGGTETEWEIEFGPTGFATGSGTTVSNITTNPYTLTGLMSGTQYDVCIRAVCGPMDLSSFVCGQVLTPADYCNGDQLVDDGGVTGDYSNSANFTYTVCPDNNGDVVYVDFISYDTEERAFGQDCYDGLTIYDGPDTNSPIISPPAGMGDVWCWDPNSTNAFQGTGDLAGMNLVGKLPSGCITFVFTSDGSVSEPGFEANVTCAAPPTCPMPFDFMVDSFDEDSTTLSWTAGGTEAEWEIEYGLSGFTPGTGTVQSTTTNPTTIGSLMDNTEYDFYLTSICGVGDESTQVGPITVTTSCTPFTAPIVEDFEMGFTTVTTNFPSSADAFTRENCWSSNAGAFYWVVAPPTQTGNFGTGPAPAVNTGNYFYTVSDGTTGDMSELVSPIYDLTALTIPALSFDYHMFGGSVGSIEVLVRAGGNDTSVVTFTGTQQTDENDAYRNSTTALAAFAGQSVQIVFKATRGGFSSDMAIDNVEILEAPSCPAVSNLALDATTSDMVTLSWTNGNTETEWTIEYGAPGFTPGTGTEVTAMMNPFTVNGLMENTPYDFYITAVCGAMDESNATGPIAARTQCTTFAVPFVEGFNSTSSTESCWTVIDENGDGDTWELDGNNPSEGDESALINTDFNGGADDDYLISPQITLTGTQRLRYDYRVQSAGEPNNIEVLLSTTGNNPADFTNTLLPVTLYSNTTYMEEIIDLSTFTGDVYVAFRVPPSSVDGWILFIDNIRFEEVPSCDEPIALTASNFTTTSADLGFTERGTATMWEIEYGAPGFVLGTGTQVAAGTNPFTLTGLIAGDCYDFYVRSLCPGGGTSPWSAVSNFCTLCDPFTLPYQEGFNTTSPSEQCWTVLDNNNDGDTWNLDGANPSEGDQSASINTDFNGGNDDDFLISPALVLSGNQRMKFQYRVQSAGEPNNMEILLSTTGIAPADFTNVLVPATQYSNTTYMEQVVDLSAFTGNAFVAFRIPPSSIDGWIMYIDDVIFEDQPACPDPQMVELSNVTSDSIDVSWTAQALATATNIEYGVCGFTPGMGTTVPATSNPFTITGLTENTCYDVYLTFDCAGTSSVASDVLTATTACNAIAAPYTEDFEMFTTTTSTFPSQANDQFERENCWSANNSPFFWVAAPTTLTASGGTGPAPGVSSGNYLYAEASSASGQDTATLSSPLIDTSALNVPSLSFDYHMAGSAMGSLEVFINSGGVQVSVLNLTGSQQNSDTDPFLTAVIDLSAYAGQTIQIDFVSTYGSGFESDIAIDNVIVEEAPTCLDPNTLVASNITATGFDFSWNAPVAQTLWDVEIQPAGVALGTANPAYSASTPSNPEMVTGLSPATTYDAYVRADCGMGDVSGWSGPISVTTLCDIIPLPYGGNPATAAAAGNDFSTFPGNCWEEGNDTDIATGPNGIDGAWNSGNFGNDPASPNGQSARINLWNLGDSDWLVTPQFDLGTSPASAYFDIALTTFGGTTAATLGSDDQVQFLITDDNGVTWNNLFTWDATTAISNTGQAVTIDLSAYSGVVRMAFWGTEGAVDDPEDNYFYVDNFSVDVTAGNDAFAKAEFSIYPVPATSRLNIMSTTSFEAIEIYSLTGRLIKRLNVNNIKTDIDVSDLATGMYLLEVYNKDAQQSFKFIKE